MTTPIVFFDACARRLATAAAPLAMLCATACTPRTDEGDGRGSGGSGGSWASGAGDDGGDEEGGSTGGGDGSSEGGTSSGAETSSGAPTSSTTSGSSSSGTGDDGSGGMTRFDLPTPPDPGDPGEEEGCQKIDFLFVIDNSNSMATNQAQLIASFPEFVDEIRATLAGVSSFHVGIVTSDPYAGNPAPCNVYGGLVTATTGKESSYATCAPYVGGFHYMTEQETDLGAKFACAGQVGTGGANDEAMMSGATRAVAADMNTPGACNDGFLRADALLVLVFITDEDDPGTCILGMPGNSCVGSGGDPNAWLSQFVAAKGGIQDNIVGLALVRGVPGNVCALPEGTERNGDRMMQFVSLLGANGFLGDICAPSFGPFLHQAVSIIDAACDQFQPPS